MLPRLLAWTALILLAAYLVFIGGGWAGIHSVQIRTLSLILIAAVLGVWGIVMIRSRSWRPQSRLMPAFAIALGTFAIGTVLSRQPRLGLDYLAYSVLLVALYLLFVRLLADSWFRPRMMSLVVVLGLIVGIWYVEACVTKWIEWWGLVGRFTTPPLRPEFASLTFGNPSAVMTESVMLTIPAVCWIGFRTGARTIGSVTLVFLALFATVVSGSRAGWLALSAGALVTAAIYLARPERRSLVLGLLGRRVVQVGVVIVAFFGVAATAFVLPGILFRSGTGGEALRASYWDAASRMFGESPLVGTGPGTWVAQRILYTPQGVTDYYIPHAHTVTFQTLAEFGLLGVAAGVVVLFIVGRLILQGLRDSDATRRTMAWGAVLSSLYFFAHNQLDFYANFPPGLFALAVPIGYLDMTSPEPVVAVSVSWQRRPSRALAVSLGSLLVLISVGGLGWSESAAAIADRAVDRLNADRPAEALADAREAVTRDPSMPPFQFTLGLAAAATGNDEEAARAFEAVARRDGLPEAWLALADIRGRLGDLAGAEEALIAAERLGVQQPAVDVAAAGLHLKIGDTLGAAARLRDAMEQFPSIASGDGLARAYPSLDPRALVAEILGDPTASDATKFELALVTGHYDEAASRASAFDDRGRYAAIVAAWQGDRGAFDRLDAGVRATPFDLILLSWCARLSDRFGDEDRADRYRKWAEIVNGTSSQSAHEFQVAVGGISEVGVPGTNSEFYGHYTYRRPTPWDQFPLDVVRPFLPKEP
jgi:O-antigen ligase/tetratricopeptide (TPR) repeat protein